MGTPVQVVFDASDPHVLARFWTEALHYRPEDHDGVVGQLLDAGRLTADGFVEIDGRRAFRDVAACFDPEGKGASPVLSTHGSGIALAANSPVWAMVSLVTGAGVLSTGLIAARSAGQADAFRHMAAPVDVVRTGERPTWPDSGQGGGSPRRGSPSR